MPQESSHDCPVMPKPNFDLIITGAGASGLSLAYHLNQVGLSDQRILLVDRMPKHANDRTWCFWEAGDNVFEPIIHRRWRRVTFRSGDMDKVLDIAPYVYKMLRGQDFYAFMNDWLAMQPNITRQSGEVRAVEEYERGARANIGGQWHTAAWVFNSIPFQTPTLLPASSPTLSKRYHSLLQHFRGWVIETPTAQFDPHTATLMDFRVPQVHGEARFVYVLPLDERRALVEFTVFGPALLADDEYRRALQAYLTQVMKLSEFAILEEENGVIPMTDAPYPARLSEHVINIGTAGGRTKPSTGYTFLRIQAQSQQIAHSLMHTGTPLFRESALRFKLYDSILLNVLATERRNSSRIGTGQRVFEELYQRNPAWLIFKFLDEHTSLAEDGRIMASTHLPTFSRAALDVIGHRLF